jgi:hypothetical protein
MGSCFTLLDNPSQLFGVTFIDQAGTNISACTRWFFADIPERCENGKGSVVDRQSLVTGPYRGTVLPEIWVWANDYRTKDERPTTGDAPCTATESVFAVSKGINQQVDVNY